MAEEASPSPASSKTKQERIRDNQRRSRARRQEYLADLERRLSECHTSCREADLQKEIFGQLQQENHRLRELLVHAGVGAEIIENYVAQDTSSASQDPNTNLRQIKPKIAMHGIGKPSRTHSEASGGTKTCGTTSTACCKPAPNTPASVATPTQAPINDLNQPHEFSRYPSTAMTAPTDTNTSFTANPMTLPVEDFDWLFQQDLSPIITPTHTVTGSSFYCDQFQMNVLSAAESATRHTVFCSVAKDMIDKYNVTPHEMEEIKARLYLHFSPPAFPGHECGIDQNTLFEILSELSIKSR